MIQDKTKYKRILSPVPGTEFQVIDLAKVRSRILVVRTDRIGDVVLSKRVPF